MARQIGIDRKEILKYALLPGIWPRTLELFTQGFPHLAYLIAIVLRTARILPAQHPYLNPKNFGDYSIRQALAAGAGEIKPEWKSLDKMIVFGAILSGLVMLVMQFCLMIAALIIAPASAQEIPTTYRGFFGTPNPTEDIAFRMLDMVFGIPGLFDSKDMADGAQPFHLALQAMLQFYSFGLLLIGVVILVYMTIAVVAETAQSGTPFGQRFNKAWTPIRIVLFFALLIPISNGINGSQYIVLLAAKGGSGLATNGWLTFNNAIQNTYLGERESLVAKPRPPDLSTVAAFVMLAKTCQMVVGGRMDGKKDVQAWVILGNDSQKLGAQTYQDVTAALQKLKSTYDFKVRFGEKDDQHDREPGKVFPYCGELNFSTSDIAEPGAAVVQQAYFDMINKMWNGSGKPPFVPGTPGATPHNAIETLGDDLTKYAKAFYDVYVLNKDEDLPPSSFKGNWADLLENYMTGKGYKIGDKTYQEDKSGGVIGKAVATQAKDGKWDADQAVLDLGWAGAGIWYNKIAQQNGALVTSVRSMPLPSRFPESMEYAASQKMKADRFVTAIERFSPSLKNGEAVKGRFVGDSEAMVVLNKVYVYWQKDDVRNDAPSAKRAVTNNIVVDAINLFFGTSGLFDMCHNKEIHPLAQLSAVGRAMIDSSIRGFATSALVGAGSSLFSILSPYLGQASSAASSFMATIAGIGLMLGFILFYLVPFLPFLYFFFAAGGWLKGIFEAMLGAPLWALGHLHFDGEGMPGEAAAGGYFMILEIFLRPILIIFGLLASLTIFSAMVKVLNDIFYLAVANVPAGAGEQNFCFTGVDSQATYARGPIDQFFYTVVYAIIVYMIGMSSFKLIDMIPRSIMRWLGEDVAAFGDQAADAAEGLVSRISVGGVGIGEQLQGGLGQAGDSLKGGIGQMIKSMMK